MFEKIRQSFCKSANIPELTPARYAWEVDNMNDAFLEAQLVSSAKYLVDTAQYIADVNAALARRRLARWLDSATKARASEAQS